MHNHRELTFEKMLIDLWHLKTTAMTKPRQRVKWDYLHESLYENSGTTIFSAVVKILARSCAVNIYDR